MLKVIPAGNSTNPVSGASSYGVDLKRPTLVSSKTSDSLVAVGSDYSRKATSVFNETIGKVQAFLNDPEGLGYAVGTSVISANLGLTPPAGRAYLFTLIALESRFKKNARNPKSSAFGYLQFMPDTKARFLAMGDKTAKLIAPYLPASSNEMPRAAMIAMGMWSHYFSQVEKHWRYSSVTGWTTKTDNPSPVIKFLKNNFSHFLKDRERGLQLLFTSLHFYSSAFELSAKFQLSPELAARFNVDAALFSLFRDHGKETTELYINTVNRRVPVAYNSKIVAIGDPEGGVKEPIITSRFQKKRKKSSQTKERAHKGIDLRATEGTPIFAPGRGVVESISFQTGPFAYGKYITIELTDGSRYRFAHLSKISDDLTNGARFSEKELLGWTGKTGTIKPHLHFEYFPPKSTVQRDPLTDPNNVWKKVFTGDDTVS